MTRWRWAAAARRGVSHERSDVRLQDAYTCFLPQGARSDVLVAVVSDGAGSASHGGEGASLVCRTIAVRSRTYFRSNDELPGDPEILEWIDSSRDRIGAVASRRGLTRRDFACTLVGMISSGASSVVFHVGDGCAVALDQTGNWFTPTWPDHGEYASTTSFVTDDPIANTRIQRVQEEIRGLAVFSDGLERLALQFSNKTPFSPFFEGMARPLFATTSIGRNRELSSALHRYLGSESINSRTDDDKSLVLAVRA